MLTKYDPVPDGYSIVDNEWQGKHEMPNIVRFVNLAHGNGEWHAADGYNTDTIHWNYWGAGRGAHLIIAVESSLVCPKGKTPVRIGGVDGYMSKESAKELKRILNTN